MSTSDSWGQASRQHHLHGVRIPHAQSDASFDLEIKDGLITAIDKHQSEKTSTSATQTKLVAPSLCHPHVHIDKAFLLGHPRYRHLQIKEGTFKEAMEMTSEAKKLFTVEDLLQRGQRLIAESCRAGVTHMRAFVEIDEIVGLKCLEAGALLKRRARDMQLCHIQLCVFAQLPLRQAGTEEGDKMRSLMQSAMDPKYEVDAVGSTPYVEESNDLSAQNISWMVQLALKHNKHLDFHLDYNLDPETKPMVHTVIEDLKQNQWTKKTEKCVTLGHCTRHIYFSEAQWLDLKQKIGNLPISFVGLPTSDLYMMKSERETGPAEIRTTLPIPKMIRDYGLNCAIGMNNIGNAFTPQGSCDPLQLANLGVGIYQTGTVQDAQLLYECCSTRAKAAIGLGPVDGERDYSLQIKEGQPADLVIFAAPPEGFETENSVEDKVYYYTSGGRETIWSGR